MLNTMDIAELESEIGMDEYDDEDRNVWEPDEWVVLVMGFRGSGKSVLDVHYGIEAMKYGLPLHTNMCYIPENLEPFNLKSQPTPLDFDRMISYKLDVAGALIQIDEIDTYLDKLRTAANQNVLTTKFLEQLRKRSLKFILSCQFGSYLPYGTLDQVDLLIYAQDMFFTQWGKEKNIRKGTTFVYTVSDKSGLFTGGRSHPWRFLLSHCDSYWGLYDTNKIHDPLQIAKKYEIKREKHIVNDDGEIYPESEETAQGQERELRQYRSTLGLVWGSQIMGFIMDNQDAIEVADNGSKVRISMSRVERALGSIKGRSRKGLNLSYNELLKIADKGTVIKRTANNMLEILKPEVMAGGDDVVSYDGSEDLGFDKVN